MKVTIFDTAGQEKYAAITRSFYRRAQGAIIVYSVTDRQSFEQVSTWIDEVRDNCCSDCAIILVANKADCTVDCRVVKREEGAGLAC